jgi:chromosome segregation ATPase
MDQHSTDTAEVLRFGPGQNPRSKVDALDDAGLALVAMLQEAANISKENVDRAMTVAHKLSMELRAAEDRISQPEAEIERLESRATRAKQWLEVIKKEIEDKLIAPMEANRPELPARLQLSLRCRL